ncbi:MAG: hypothetical protein IPM37_15660 [Hahellaceae bacterium]|nr:hypothetical protein [Hahellaceae bacterium]
MKDNDLNSTLAAYRDLQGVQGKQWRMLADLRPTGLHCDSRRVSSLADVWNVINAFDGGSGWIQCSSGQSLVIAGIPENLKGQPVLAAELFDQQRSLHVTCEGDHWSLSVYTEESGNSHLAENVTFLSTSENHRLRYRRYWQAKPGEGFRLQAARFTGLIQEKAQ